MPTLRPPRHCEPTLDADRALRVRAGLRLDMQNSSQERRRNIAPPPPKPRGGRSALAGERSEPVRLGVRDHHTRSPCKQSPAQNEQWGQLDLPPLNHPGSAQIAAI